MDDIDVEAAESIRMQVLSATCNLQTVPKCFLLGCNLLILDVLTLKLGWLFMSY
jgi:hypothetical protein